MAGFEQSAIDFIAANAVWAGPVVAVAAFAESFVIVSLIVPGSSILVAAGALVPDGTLPWAPLVGGGVIGAVLGDGVSYWLGRRFGDGLRRMWPFTRYPDLISGGIAFFERHGEKSVFIGRFFGPMRAVVPLAAGLLAMPPGRFWLANIASALIWAPGVVAMGAGFGIAADYALGRANMALAVGVLTFIAGGVSIWLAIVRARRR